MSRLPHAFHYVDAYPSRMAIATLTGAGWSHTAIAAAATHLGPAYVSDGTIGLIANGQRARVRNTTEAAILAIDPLHMPTMTVHALEPQVSRVGSVRRIQALLAMGHTHERMTAEVGFQTGSFLSRTTNGRCQLSTHLKVAAMYRRLITFPGTSELTRQRARARGYRSAMAWNDIDYDPEPERDDAA